MKTCKQCGVTKPLADYPVKRGYTLNFCRLCERARQRESKARLKIDRLTPDYAERRTCARCRCQLRYAAPVGRTPYCKRCGSAVRQAQKPPAKCSRCGVPCWGERRSKNPHCLACYKIVRSDKPKRYKLSEGDWNDRRAQQAGYDKEVRNRKVKKARERDPERFMEFALGEFWKLDGPCSGRNGRVCREGPNGTRKWIVGPGSCYTCATGRPRTLFRFSEFIEPVEVGA